MERLEVGPVTLNLHEDGVVLCKHSGGLSNDNLYVCHPLG